MKNIPHLEKTLTSSQLIVKGKPFLILGGEVHNSSFSSADYMKSVWPDLVESNFNTILGSVCWENIEPEENRFDFSELDTIISDARKHKLHLILLWFGSFKNGVSTYVPGWVKKDPVRFPRVLIRDKNEGGGGDSTSDTSISGSINSGPSSSNNRLITADILSLFNDNSLNADIKAFSELIEYIKQVDHDHSTVLMVQVENEVGILGDSRDRSLEAEKYYNQSVPLDLIDFLVTQKNNLSSSLYENLHHFFHKYSQETKKLGDYSWQEVFGSNQYTDELFMAYYYSKYLEKIASAGKHIYPIPLYTNVWLNSGNSATVAGGGSQPGDYPSGGALSHTLDIWKQFAPSLDFISPDIYLSDYSIDCTNYRIRNQPLFIPEQRRDDFGARRSWLAFGTHLAIGVSPFGVDTIPKDDNPYKKHYGLLSSVSSILLLAQRRADSIMGFYFDEPESLSLSSLSLSSSSSSSSPSSSSSSPSSSSSSALRSEKESWTATFEGINVVVERSFVFGKSSAGNGILIYLGSSKFLLIGWGFRATFKSVDPKSTFTGILSFKEKEIVHGELRTIRTLNGDETRGGKFCNMPNEDPDYGGFPIAVTIPARTMIAECDIYSISE